MNQLLAIGAGGARGGWVAVPGYSEGDDAEVERRTDATGLKMRMVF